MSYGLHAFCVCMHWGTAGPGPGPGLVWGVPGQKGTCAVAAQRMSWSHSRSSQTSSFVYQSSALQSTEKRNWAAWKKPASDSAETAESSSSWCMWCLQVRKHLHSSDGWGCAAHLQHQERNKNSDDIIHIIHFLGIWSSLQGFGQANSNPKLMSLTWEFLGREVNFFTKSTCTSCFCHTSFKGKC